MTWTDAIRLLESVTFGDETELMKDLNPVEESMVKQVKLAFEEVNKIFANRTEMDACVRVVQVLIAVFRIIPEDTRKKLRISCQPSMMGHSVFTDFLIAISEQGTFMEEKPKVIVEVKKSSISTDLSLETKETAQTIREVHIATQQTDDPLLFILTNSREWSFGLGERVGNRVRITSTKYTNTQIGTSTQSPYYVLTQLLIKYL